MPAEAADMNSIYEESLSNLRDRIPVDQTIAKKGVASIAEKEQAAKIYYANVKTNLLLAWVVSNVRVVIPVLQQRRGIVDDTFQGLLIFSILSGLHVQDAFGQDAGLTKLKGYLVFILAFTAVTNCVVCLLLKILFRC